jgi:hypothetical protein
MVLKIRATKQECYSEIKLHDLPLTSSHTRLGDFRPKTDVRIIMPDVTGKTHSLVSLLTNLDHTNLVQLI